MSAQVSMDLKGDHKVNGYLSRLLHKLNEGKAVNVGFLKGANYVARPAGMERLRQGIEKLNSVGPPTPGAKVRAPRATAEPTVFNDPIPIAQVAFWNEFGTKTMHPRPFMRNTIAKHSGEWGDNLAVALKTNQFYANSALRVMGEVIKDQIQTTINEWPADNAPLTIAIKGFNKGLVDSGQMRDSVGYQVTGT